MPDTSQQQRTGSPHRARAAADKAARRESILSAAGELFAERDGELPSVAEVATRAGLAKGTVYIYFRAKEEIFLALLTREFAAWIGFLDEMIGAPDRVARGPEAMAEDLVADLLRRRDMLRMAALCHATLEQQTDEASLLAFKQATAAGLDALSQRLEATLPGLGPGEGLPHLVRVYALTIGLWQLADPPRNARKLLRRPELAHLLPDFETSLRTGLTALLIPAFDD